MGMYQGPREIARRQNMFLPDDAKNADAVILSHGHLDHCGKLPVLTRAGYAGPIYLTPATAAVARIVLEDAADIQVEDAEYLNRREQSPDSQRIEPLYRPGDLPAVFRAFRHVPYEQRMALGNDVFFRFFDAGHILGSAYVLLEWKEAGRDRSLLFTADIGRYGSPILADPHPLAGPAENVITESTYGDRLHAPMSEVEPQFLAAVKHCIERRSRLIVPSFAVGRTQTVLWYIQKFIREGTIPEIPIFIDSPMGIDVSQAHKKFPDHFDDETRALIGEGHLFSGSRVTFARTSEQSRKINGQPGACVIIASSPTCEFGRVLHHLRQSLDRPDDLVTFVGWIPPQTLGRRLQDGMKRVRIYDRWYDVRCQVRTIHGLSAHADGEELAKFLAPTLKAETTAYIVHGEPDQAEGLARRLLEKGIGKAVVPAMESSVIDL
jgi:metallo-beta-lactamase family protein